VILIFNFFLHTYEKLELQNVQFRTNFFIRTRISHSYKFIPTRVGAGSLYMMYSEYVWQTYQQIRNTVPL
jgi:hypothetical protein